MFTGFVVPVKRPISNNVRVMSRIVAAVGRLIDGWCTLFGGGDEAGRGRLIGLGVGEVGDRVSLDEWRRNGTSRSRPRSVRQKVSGVVHRAQVAAAALLMLLLATELPLRRRRPASVTNNQLPRLTLSNTINTANVRADAFVYLRQQTTYHKQDNGGGLA